MKLRDEFWEFVNEREWIRLRRLSGQTRPWTEDWILQEYSFTNVKRHHDRVTTQLREEFYEKHRIELRDDMDAHVRLLLNCVVFRYFGTIWSARVIGWSEDWSAERREQIRSYGIQNDLTFTSAYIVPNCGRSEPKYEIVLEIVDGVMRRAEEIVQENSWQKQTRILSECYGCGSFMAKEILLDYYMASGQEPSDWQTWTPVGPGARRGAGWVLTGEFDRLSETEALSVIRKIYYDWRHHWRHEEKLDLTDVQFQMCEFDKYMRVKTGAGKPKRLFKPTIDGVTVESLRRPAR